jgi:hypothetical protein
MRLPRRRFLALAGGAVGGMALSLSAPRLSTGNGGTLLFGIGIHIEPFGAVPSPLAGPVISPPGINLSYFNAGLYQRHTDDLRLLATIAERHGGRLTVQAQTPFTIVARSRGDRVFEELEGRGHEIALHFHEDAHLGRNPEALPVATWAAVMEAEVGFLRAAGARSIRFWSGGNLYPGILEAATRAGLDVQGDYKNPRTQQSHTAVLGVHPWRPAGGPTASDLSAFARHDPAGAVVYLPSGVFGRTDYASARRSPAMGGDAGYFQFLRESVAASIAAARPDRVNVFHLTIHPGEFQSSPTDPHTVVEQFLADTIDPAVAAGVVRWATFSEMADAYREWEAANPGVDPRAGEGGVSPASPIPSVSRSGPIGPRASGGSR